MPRRGASERRERADGAERGFGGPASDVVGVPAGAKPLGQRFDARYYRQTWGRFSQVDPLHVGAAMTDPQQWNRYAYARNNPLKFVDSTGLYSETVEVRGDMPVVLTYDGSTLWPTGPTGGGGGGGG